MILGLKILHPYFFLPHTPFVGGLESERAFFGSGGGKGKGREKTAAAAELLAAEREFLAHFLHH